MCALKCNLELIVKTKDYTYSNFQTTRSELTSNKKGFFGLGFCKFPRTFKILKFKFLCSMHKFTSQVSFYRQCCINMAKACHVLSCLKLYFLFARHHNNFVSKEQAVMSSFICWRAACSWNLFVYWFYDDSFYHYLTRLGNYLLLEAEKWKAGLWKW